MYRYDFLLEGNLHRFASCLLKYTILMFLASPPLYRPLPEFYRIGELEQDTRSFSGPFSIFQSWSVNQKHVFYCLCYLWHPALCPFPHEQKEQTYRRARILPVLLTAVSSASRTMPALTQCSLNKYF